jgi:FKBP-type peptidyl-prolyl cis-trans isomerase
LVSAALGRGLVASIPSLIIHFENLMNTNFSGSSSYCRLLRAMALLGIMLSGCVEPSGDGEQLKQQGIAFLAENAKKPGIVTTASGLQYEVLQEGRGATPGPTATVTVNYRGSLTNGNEFDNGNGISFPLNRVIPGWTEGLQLMKEGAKYRFYIPAELAYGERGAGALIPPNAPLIFEVELVKAGQP